MSTLDCSTMTARDAIRLSRRAAHAIFLFGAIITLSTMTISSGELSSDMLPSALITGLSLSTPFLLLTHMTDKQSLETNAKAGPRSLCLTFKFGLVFTALLWFLIVADVLENVGSSEISFGLMILASPFIISPLMVLVYRSIR